MGIFKKLVDEYMVIFINISRTSNHLQPLQVENCDSNSRLVVDEDDNGKFRLESVNSPQNVFIYCIIQCLQKTDNY